MNRPIRCNSTKVNFEWNSKESNRMELNLIGVNNDRLFGNKRGGKKSLKLPFFGPYGSGCKMVPLIDR